jgi:glycosyltransferase involved in cell wall biosynthesis
MSPIRVLHLINNLGSGGAQRQLLELVRGLDPARVESLVAMYDPVHFFEDDPRYADIPVRILERSHRGDPRMVGHLADLLVSERVDILHAWLVVPGIWAWLAARKVPGLRLICTELSDAGQGPLLWTIARKLTFPRADLVMANSHRATAIIAAEHGLAPERLAAVHNGIDVRHWTDEAPQTPAVDAALERLPDDGLRVVMVGSFHAWKDHAMLIRALKRIRDDVNISVILIGAAVHPEVLEQTKQAVERAGLSDRVVRMEAISDLRALHQHMDALVLTSRFEGLPNVVLEAMTAGLPILATDVSDLAELITEGQEGWVVPVGDDAALAERLTRFANLSAAKREDMKANARALGATFSVERMAEETSICYEQMMTRPPIRDARSNS